MHPECLSARSRPRPRTKLASVACFPTTFLLSQLVRVSMRSRSAILAGRATPVVVSGGGRRLPVAPLPGPAEPPARLQECSPEAPASGRAPVLLGLPVASRPAADGSSRLSWSAACTPLRRRPAGSGPEANAPPPQGTRDPTNRNRSKQSSQRSGFAPGFPQQRPAAHGRHPAGSVVVQLQRGVAHQPLATLVGRGGGWPFFFGSMFKRNYRCVNLHSWTGTTGLTPDLPLAIPAGHCARTTHTSGEQATWQPFGPITPTSPCRLDATICECNTHAGHAHTQTHEVNARVLSPAGIQWLWLVVTVTSHMSCT